MDVSHATSQHTSLADLPPQVLGYIVDYLTPEDLLKLGLTSKIFNSRIRDVEAQYKMIIQNSYYFCFLFKNTVDTYSAILKPSLRAYQSKSWFGLWLSVNKKFDVDSLQVIPERKIAYEPENEVEQEGRNILHEAISNESAPDCLEDKTNSKLEVKAATINILIQKIVLGDVEPVYQESLCCAFECFIALSTLLKIIFHKFHNFSPFAEDDPNLKTKKITLGQSVLSLLRKLIVRRSDAFCAEHWQLVENFAQEISTNETWTAQSQLLWKTIAQELAKKLEHKPVVIKLEGPVPEIVLLKQAPKILAQQITLFMFRAYCDMTVSDLMDSKKPKGSRKTFITYFNAIANWVVLMIVSCAKIKERVKMYQFFVELAQSFYDHRDYHTLCAVLSALSTSEIFRLKHTKQEVSTKHNAQLQKLDDLINNAWRNSKTYRDALHASKPPCLPFLGVFFQDLSFVMDGNPPTIERQGAKLVNCWKARMCNKIISEALLYQNTKYPFEEDTDLQLYVWQKIIMNDVSSNELFEMSRRLEPRGCARADVE